MNPNLKDIDERKETLVKYALAILTTIMLIFSFLNFKRGLIVLSIIELILFFIGIFLFYFTTKKKYIKLNIIILLSSLYFFTIFSYLQEKIHFTTFIWASAVTTFSIHFLKKRDSIILISSYLVVTYTLLIYKYTNSSSFPSPALINISAFILSYTLFIYYYERTREISESKLLKEIKIRKEAEKKNELLITELNEKINQIKQLSSFLPICSSCKKIRNDNGYWDQIEDYISKNSDTQFSHSICPDCTKKLYPELYDEMNDKNHDIFK